MQLCRLFTKGLFGNRMNLEEVKMDDGKGGSCEDSISTLYVKETKDDDVVVGSSRIINLNMMQEETLEATIMDLEELANRIKWIKIIQETNQDTTSSSSAVAAPSHWKFAD
ncbi:hypothetical protein L6452_36289 [Arctium lappa]|uniref:Uncharacterized protein n=1 Tax=Arctium lappa TaxID=4217 RepID=A0ACB8Y9G6_ARCLA|nr:hypothetical protein L6452_36289 [Arctium lappa]